MDDWRWNELTPRQKEIVLAAVMNHSVKIKRLGERFGIHYNTLRFHLNRAMKTLGVSDRVELAYELGRHSNDKSSS